MRNKSSKIGTHLYLIQAKTTGHVKIGRSDDPEKRLAQLQTGNPTALRLILVAHKKGDLEKHLHRLLGRYHAVGEWFREECLGSFPIEIWDQRFTWYQEDPDWWKRD